MSSLGIRVLHVSKFRLWVSQRPNEIVTTRAPASTSRRAIKKWSMQQGGPSASFSCRRCHSGHEVRGSSLDRSSASKTRRDESTSNARWVKLSMPSVASS